MTDKTAQARAERLNNLMVIIKAQSARISPHKTTCPEEVSLFLGQIKQSEADCKKTKEQQSIDRLECAEIARNWENSPNLLQAFQTKFREQIQPNPNNQWARLLWFGLSLAAQNSISISGQDLQSARPNQTFDDFLEAPPIEPVQIIQICFDYSPTVLYDLQLLISFYSSIINSK
jgi:hypothetical protein